MIREIATSVRLTVATSIVCCVGYPLAILGFAAVASPDRRLGSLVEGTNGAPVGSRLIAQGFTRPEYFWPRPSACGHDAAAAGGSNLSPASPLLRDRAKEIICRLDLPEGTEIPAELLAASGSGLDPHISLAGAIVQIPRVASRRTIGENELRQLVERHAGTSAPAHFGRASLVNVLLLNLTLDEAYPTP